MPSQDSIALSFLALKSSDFTYTIYRKKLAADEGALKGTRFLPDDCSVRANAETERSRYAISLQPAEGYEQATAHAWIAPGLTTEVIYNALSSRVLQLGLTDKVETPEKSFIKELSFLLRQYDDSKEIMRVRPYGLRVADKFGLFCSFSLRINRDSQISPKRKLELSLTHKNGRVNEDYYLDQYKKIEDFLRQYLDCIKSLELHDGTRIELDEKLTSVPSFTLSTRTYIFGGNKEGQNQFFGLRDYGPYAIPTGEKRLVFLFSNNDHTRSQDLFKALRGDTYSTFPGMEKLFRTPIGKENVSGMEIPSFSNSDLLTACSQLKSQYRNEQIVPIGLVPMSKHISEEETQSYYAAKHAFISNGLASQFIDRKRTIGDSSALKWSVSNIALAIFAKMGGVPWRVKPSTEKCLIVGIGQAHRLVNDKVEKFVAYSVLTDSSGIYESIQLLGSAKDRGEYLDDLKKNLRVVLLSHTDRYQSFVLHVTFSMKKDEIEAIKGLLDELKNENAGSREFVAIKFNDHNDFFGFSTSHNSRIPYEGCVTPLSNREFLMWFSGLGIADSKAPKKPERPVHLSILYPEKPLSPNDLRRILQDAMNIAGANWRGFNAKSIPISVYYAKLIADYYGHFREANLPEVDIDNLPPWFL